MRNFPAPGIDDSPARLTALSKAMCISRGFDGSSRDGKTRLEPLLMANKILNTEMAAGVMHDVSIAMTPVFSLVQALHAIDNLPPQAQKITASRSEPPTARLMILRASSRNRVVWRPVLNVPCALSGVPTA